MKNLYIILLFIATSFTVTSCHKMPVSHLEIKNIVFPNPLLTVVQGLTDADAYSISAPPKFPWDPPGGVKTPTKYYKRITNKSPWVGLPFFSSTVEGGRPLTVALESVRTEGASANVEKLTNVLKIVAEGRIEIPFVNDIPVGKYILSLRISNMNTSKVAYDIFVIEVTTTK